MVEKIVSFARKYALHIGAAIFIVLLLFGYTVWFVQKKPSLTVFKTSLGCIICHKRESAMYSHSPYSRAECLSCHLEHGESKKTMVREPIALTCFACHREAQKGLRTSFLHPPFEKGNCLSCHKPHVSEDPILLSSSPTTICIACHRIGDDASKPFPHQPFIKRQCMSCHSGHGTNYKALARGKGKDLCYNCHPKIATKTNYAVQHEPFESGDCSTCHAPHASANPSLLTAKTPRLCYNCHPNVDLVISQVSHHPVPEGKISCESCHDPHAAKFDSLTLKSAMKISPGCLVCHVPHGSDNSPLLKFGTLSLCTKCHSKTVYASGTLTAKKRGHSHPLNVWDADAGEPLTCTSTCHKKLVFSAFTESKNGDLREVMNEDLCTSCHKGHLQAANNKGIHGNSTFHVQFDPPAPLTDFLCLKCHEPSELP